MPLDWRIGLTSGDRFRVVRLHPGPVRTVGRHARGESAPFAVEADAEVYAIVPDDGKPFELGLLAEKGAPPADADAAWGSHAEPETALEGPDPPLPPDAVMIPAFREGSIIKEP